MTFCRQFVAAGDTQTTSWAPTCTAACRATELPRALRRRHPRLFLPSAHSGHEHGSL